jgi:hypothetical protein
MTTKQFNMKMKILLLTLLISVLTICPILGQENDSTDVKFGLGTSLFNLSEYINESQSINSIYMTIDLSSKFRIEPSFGFALSDGLSQYFIGVGAFGKKTISKFNLLYGLRVGLGSSERFALAPTIGGEYYFIKKFSIGSEVQLRGSKANEDWTFLTNSSVILRFYF